MRFPPPVSQPSANAGAPVSAASPRDVAVRPTLPDRNVTAATIEDAYVRFILYCNPALPLGVDTANLREAFRNPPRNGGKSFSTFVIFELVRKFYAKEIRTWTELTIRLGVEPPDPSKDESAQKIAQYGVRLKKWMNSMHVKAFFEYLMDIRNDYWTNIPNNPNPIGQPVRDGVAVEDDMALRALLPQIRPKRGRKRPEDDEAGGSPAHQRPRLSPFPAMEDTRPPVRGPWPGQAEPHSSMPLDPACTSNPWSPGGFSHAPLSRWPNSALTPTNRAPPWDDAMEPRSAITPSKPKLTSQRRGPKNVSSAWRPGIQDSGVKARGRPPMNRTTVDAPYSPSTPPLPASHSPGETEDSSNSGGHVRSPNPPSQVYQAQAQHSYLSPQTCAPDDVTPPEIPRPCRPSISLQVPERPASNVRLATPTPVITVNEEPSMGQPEKAAVQPEPTERWSDYPQSNPGSTSTENGSRDIPEFYFERVEDRTNIDEIIAYMVRNAYTIDWLDAEGNLSYPPTFDECLALVHATLEHIYKTSTSTHTFLINLAAMTAGRLMFTTSAGIRRMGSAGSAYKYLITWEYTFGSLRGDFRMEQLVPHSMYRAGLPGAKKESDLAGDVDSTEGPFTKEEWEKRYYNLIKVLKERDEELQNLRKAVFRSSMADHFV